MSGRVVSRRRRRLAGELVVKQMRGADEIETPASSRMSPLSNVMGEVGIWRKEWGRVITLKMQLSGWVC